MPLPLLLLGGALLVGGFGVKKGLDAASDSNRAAEINSEATQLFEKAERKLKTQKKRTTKTLEALREKKLIAWNDQMGRFVKLFGKLKNVELSKSIDDSGSPSGIDSKSLLEMREVCTHASEVLGGGLSTLGAGALVGFGAYGGATMFAAASTGTAISSLTGVAATNATLAWFGGGALSAGGLGMAGGMAVLGGIVAGPVLLVGGMMLSAKAKEKLAVARTNRAQALKAAEEMNCARTALNGIEKVANQFQELIDGLCPRFDLVLQSLDKLIKTRGSDYTAYSEDERRLVYTAVEFAHLTKKALETPLLTKSGALKRGLGRQIESIESSPLLLDEA